MGRQRLPTLVDLDLGVKVTEKVKVRIFERLFLEKYLLDLLDMWVVGA